MTTAPLPLPEYEEWRLALVLPEGDVKAGALVAELRERLPPEIAIHRKGRRGIRLYADSHDAIEQAEQVVAERLKSHRVRADVGLTRWNPGEERWHSPYLPVTPPRAPLPDSWANVDEMAWEVRLRFEHDWEADRLLDDLLEKGAAAVGGWKRCLVAVEDETTARQRAGELRLSAPTAEIEVRPLSRWRRWMIRQKIVGSYAGHFDAYDGGFGGGGGGDG